jgi:tryptophan-rich sensory protein
MTSVLRHAAALVISVLACSGAAAVGAIATSQSVMTWYRTLERPTWSPPDWLFGPVWTLLYAMMAVAAFLVWRRGFGVPGQIPDVRPAVRIALVVFAVQLALNALWSWLFFAMRSPLAGLIEIVVLWIAIAATIALFWPLSRIAAGMMVPYLAWVTFATALNGTLWWMNR